MFIVHCSPNHLSIAIAGEIESHVIGSNPYVYTYLHPLPLPPTPCRCRDRHIKLQKEERFEKLSCL